MIIMLLGTHLFLTVRLRCPQRKILTAIKLSVQRDKGASGDVSQFGALATALAATIGTGNIVGVATAVALGGPGAVFWCWITGVFGIATKYAEGLLAIKYRVKTADGTMLGGPMYALERGLGMRWLGVLFAVFTAVAAFGIGSMVQSNAITTMVGQDLGLSPIISGVIITSLAALVVLGGVRSIARVCSAIVPFMAAIYVLGCIYILFINGQYVWQALHIIVESAFAPTALGGGLTGGGIMLAARYGIARGLFSNESGLGSAPIVAAAARTRNPVRQALVSSTGPFWDTVVVCALTGLVIVSSVLAHPDISYNDGALLTKLAFSKIPYVGSPLLTVGMFTFAFSTILGWCYYGESAAKYLNRRSVKPYRWLYIVTVMLGCVSQLTIVWDLSDFMNALMALPNLVALLLLSGVAAQETNRYLWHGNLDDAMDDADLDGSKTS